MLLVLLALLLGVGALNASAVGVTDKGPATASAIDDQTHTIAPNTATWFRFNYSGDESLVSLTMPDCAKYNVIFEVYTPGQAKEWWNADPVGQATDKGDDHFWLGSSQEAGTYYVRVVNAEPAAMTYKLLLAGTAVDVVPTTTTPVVVVPAAALRNNTVPERALFLESKTYDIPANTSLWYRFSFPSDDSLVSLKVADGKNNGLTFEVYGWDQIAQWWQTDPAGRGNISGDNLVWSSSGDAWTTFYVRIVNDNAFAVSYDFAISGARGPF
jgi:hypothetical protein